MPIVLCAMKKKASFMNNHWAAIDKAVRMASRFCVGVSGGIEQPGASKKCLPPVSSMALTTTLKEGTPDQVHEEVVRAIELTGGRHFLLAPGCSIPPETPTQNLLAIRTALSMAAQ